MRQRQKTIVAIEGDHGSGKTHLAHQLVSHFTELRLEPLLLSRPLPDSPARAALLAGAPAAEINRLMDDDARQCLHLAATSPARLTILVRHLWSRCAYRFDDQHRAEYERQVSLFGEPNLWIFCSTPPRRCLDAVLERGEARFGDRETNLSLFIERHYRFNDLSIMSNSPVIDGSWVDPNNSLLSSSIEAIRRMVF